MLPYEIIKAGIAGKPVPIAAKYAVIIAATLKNTKQPGFEKVYATASPEVREYIRRLVKLIPPEMDDPECYRFWGTYHHWFLDVLLDCSRRTEL